jgi:hypothetical protein
MLQALVKLLTSKKALATLGGAGALGGVYLLGRGLDSNEEPDDIKLKNETSQPKQSATSVVRTKSHKATVKPTTTQTEQTQNEKQQTTPTVGTFLPELLKLYELSNLLAHQYEQDAKTYYQVFQEYSEKLEKLVPYIALGLSKTPLGMKTGLDLPEIMYNFLKYYPWDFVKQNFSKLLSGYYILKANGHEDLSRYTIEDLITVADNPALAQATDQNWLSLISNYAENYKLVMQSVLDQIGKLKDFYTYRLNVLKTQADMIENIIKTIMNEEKLNFEKWLKTFNAYSQHWKRVQDVARGWESLNLRRQQLELKQRQQLEPLIKINKEK